MSAGDFYNTVYATGQVFTNTGIFNGFNTWDQPIWTAPLVHITSSVYVQQFPPSLTTEQLEDQLIFNRVLELLPQLIPDYSEKDFLAALQVARDAIKNKLKEFAADKAHASIKDELLSRPDEKIDLISIHRED